MSELSDKIDSLVSTQAETSTKLTKVIGEQAGLLEAVADLTDKLAAALAAGQAVPPEVLASINRAIAQAEEIKAKAEALDVNVADTAP